MANHFIATIKRWAGLSTDTKPTDAPVGSTYLEYDSQQLYMTPDGGTTWVVKNPSPIQSYGTPLTFQIIAPASTPTGIGADIYTYNQRTIAYTSGGVYVMKVGDMVVGAIGGATAVIVGRTITGGTDAGGNAAGVLTLKAQVGTFQAENLNVEGNANVATIAGNSAAYDPGELHSGAVAKAAIISVEDQSALVTFDGTLPGQTSDNGHLMIDGDSIVLYGAIEDFRCIDAVDLSNTAVKVTCFF
jgi:hypothetical protein